MSGDVSHSVVSLGNLSKPADTLIRKVSAAVGGIFAPYQIKRIAKAEAEADLTKANSEIEITDLHRRAMHRFVEEEAIRQENMEETIQKALPQLKEDSDPNSIEDDWITNFFDKCRIISDDEMQVLWSRVLAGEANEPGTYSKRTVNFLSDLDKFDAQLFITLCGFGWNISDVVPLIFNIEDDIYNKNGIDFSSLTHLDSIGLIQFSNLTGFVRRGFPESFTLFYYGESLAFQMHQPENNTLSIGKVLLTKIGQELAPICGSTPVNGFMEYVKTKWAKHILTNDQPQQDAATNKDSATS